MGEALTHTQQWVKARTSDKENVFDRQRLDADFGHTAVSASVINEFITTLETLCERDPITGQTGGLYRRLGNEPRDVLSISINPTRVRYPYMTQSELGRATVYNVKRERKLLKPKYMPIGRYAISENVFIDLDTDKPMVEKTLRTSGLMFGFSDEISAIKNATEAEVLEALDMVTAAVVGEAYDTVPQTFPETAPLNPFEAR